MPRVSLYIFFAFTVDYFGKQNQAGDWWRHRRKHVDWYYRHRKWKHVEEVPLGAIVGRVMFRAFQSRMVEWNSYIFFLCALLYVHTYAPHNIHTPFSFLPPPPKCILSILGCIYVHGCVPLSLCMCLLAVRVHRMVYLLFSVFYFMTFSFFTEC